MSSTDEDPTIGRLVADVSRDVSQLVQHEIALAKAELKVSVRASGWGAALFAVAAFLLLLVVILASITFGFLLTMTGLHAAWAFGIVTLAYLLIALVLAWIGVLKFKKVRIPKRTIETARQLPDAFRPSPTRQP